MGYVIPIEIYESIKEVVKDEKLAREVVKTIEKGLEEVERKAKEQKAIIKAELKDELRKELITKEEFYGEIRRLEEKFDQKIETIRQELKGEIRELRVYLKFVIILILLGFTLFNPQFFELIKNLVGLLR
jgi:hypothetical protein